MQERLRVGVVTIFPQMLEAVTGYGITGRAVEAGLLTVRAFDPRIHARDRHRTVDDKPYGGGPGMVMQVEPVRAAIREARAALPEAAVIHLSPQGRPLDQATVAGLAEREALILLAGRYEGIDERIVERDVDEEFSVGDYVLSGGELAAMVVIDAVCRLLPGALGDEGSAAADSFVDGLLDHPHYTRPEEIDGQRVPAVLRSGDHEAIRRWRRMQALGRTFERRPDLLAERQLDDEARRLLDAYLTGAGE